MGSMSIMGDRGRLTTCLTLGFRCLPRYGNDLRRQYNRLLSEIARSDLLSFLLSQILKRKVQIGKLDYDLWKDILEANYALS